MKSACGVKALDEMVTAMTPFTGGFSRASGVAAFDSVAGQLTGRTSDLSMATLCQMAQDNGMLLFPHRLPVEFLLAVPAPYILLHKHHYTAIKKMEDFPGDLGTHVHVVTPYAIPDFLMDIVEAREMRGSRSIFSRVGREFKRAARNPYVQMGVGLATGNPWLAAGLGAYGGSLKGGGLKGAALGGLQGGLAGGAGAGIGGAIGGAAKGFTASAPGFLSTAKGVGVGAAKGFGAGTSAYGERVFSPFSVGSSVTTGGQAAGAHFAAAGRPPGAPYGPLPAEGAMAPGASAARAIPPTGGGELAAYDTSAMSPAMKDWFSGTGNALSITDKVAQQTGSGSFREFFQSTSGKFGIGSFLTSALIPSPEYNGPEVNADQIAELARRGPLTPTGQLVAGEVEKVLGAPYGQAYTNIAEPYARRAQELLGKQFAVERKATEDRYAAAGALDSGEYRKALADLDNQERQEVANIHADVAVKLAAAEGDLRAQFAQIGLQLDRQTMGDLLGISGMQIEQAATQYGASVADVQSLRQMFAGMGTLFTAHSLGLTGGGGGGFGGILKSLAA